MKSSAMENERILIVDDEPDLVSLLSYLLQDEGCQTLAASSGEEALVILRTERVDLVLLDINLPGIDGLELSSHLRGPGKVPLIFLTCRDEPEDVIRGLKKGADDYITKPFNHQELILRIQNILRRNEKEETISCGDLLIDLTAGQVRRSSQTIHLTSTEFAVLRFLALSEGKVISWQTLIEQVWGYHDWEGGYEIVKVTIGRLRKKIETDASHPCLIKNVWGKGYQFISSS